MDVRKSHIAAGKSVFKGANVVMQQETTEAQNSLSNAVLYDCETIEHLNSNNSRLSGQINTLK